MTLSAPLGDEGSLTCIENAITKLSLTLIPSFKNTTVYSLRI